MGDKQWELMTKISQWLFVIMIATILITFVLGTLTRIICRLIKKDCWFKRFFNKPLVIYSIKRTQSALITIILVATATFLLLRILPDGVYYMDYINKIPLDKREAAIASARARMGLDKPIINQLLEYYKNIIPIKKTICVSQSLTLDANNSLTWSCSKYENTYINFGTSLILYKNILVTDILFEKAAVSFVIGLIASAGEILIGYPLGIWMAARKDKFIDRFGKVYTVLIDAIPAIVYYFLIMIFFQQVFKLSTYFDRYDMSTWITPLVSLLIAGIPGIAIWVRRYTVDEINSDYVKFAKAKGLSKNRIMFIHVLRNSVVPLVRTIPTAFIFSLLGSYYVEKIYSIPGLGQTLLNAINRQDNPLVQGLVIIFAFVSTFAYLVGDIATALADPRISLTAKED